MPKRKPAGDHQTTRTFQALKKIKVAEVQKQLQDAVDKAYAVSHPSKYLQVNVLLFRFDNDDLNGADMENELATVFKDEYGYKVHKVVLPGKATKRPGFKVATTLDDLDDQGALGENCLVIVVFFGHGLIRDHILHVGGALHNGNFVGHSLKWTEAFAMLRDSPCDVLQIIDCCHAAEASMGTIEMLAATSATEVTSSDADTCFTQAVLKQLKYQGPGAFSISEFAASMVTNRYMLNLQYFPIYGPRTDKRSIVLQKVEDVAAKDKVVIKSTAKSPRILITAHTEEDLTQMSINDIKKWVLSNIPPAVKSIEFTVEGWFDADSSLLLLTVPLEVGYQLVDDDAYTIIGMVSSTNRLLQPAVATPLPSALALRPPTGSENTQPGPSK